MGKNSDTTITDKSDFSVKVIDTSRFSGLDDDSKEIFEIVRNSMLEIIPAYKGKHQEIAIKFAENYAFISLNAFQKFYENKIEKELEALKEELQTSIDSLGAASTGTGTP